MSHPDPLVHEYHIKENDSFPNSQLPALLYKRAVIVPSFFAVSKIDKVFKANGWENTSTGGMITKHHYHSTVHTVIAAIKGKTVVLLGGENGKLITFEKGDLLVIPAGVAYKNLGKEKDIQTVMAFYGDKVPDINYGGKADKKSTAENIAAVPHPPLDPLYGDHDNGLAVSWIGQQKIAEPIEQ